MVPTRLAATSLWHDPISDNLAKNRDHKLYLVITLFDSFKSMHSKSYSRSSIELSVKILFIEKDSTLIIFYIFLH